MAFHSFSTYGNDVLILLSKLSGAEITYFKDFFKLLQIAEFELEQNELIRDYWEMGSSSEDRIQYIKDTCNTNTLCADL